MSLTFRIERGPRSAARLSCRAFTSRARAQSPGTSRWGEGELLGVWLALGWVICTPRAHVDHVLIELC